MDEHRTSGYGRRNDDPPTGRGRRESDPEYDWGGKPGEDFGPMPGPLPSGRPSDPLPADDQWPQAWEAPPERSSTPAVPVSSSVPLAPADDEPHAPIEPPEPEPRDADATRVQPAADAWGSASPGEWTRPTPSQQARPDQDTTQVWHAADMRAGPANTSAGAPPPFDHADPIDLEVDAATSVRRSVGRGTVPLASRRRGGPSFVGLVALLVVLGALGGVALAILSRQPAATTLQPTAATAAVAAPSPAGSPAPGMAILPISTPTVMRAGPAPVLTYTPAPADLEEPTPEASPVAQGAPSPEATLTPLTLGPPSGSPAPGTGRAATATPRAGVRGSPPALLSTMPPLVTPPSGARFPTPTPIRIGPTRTPPPVPTARTVSFYNRIWSEQTLHKVGDTASICAQAASGASAEVFVLGPDRSNKALGQFTPPAERVCTTLPLDGAGLYVLSMIVKDAGGNEIDRQSAALYVGR